MERNKLLVPLCAGLVALVIGTGAYAWWSAPRAAEGPPRFLICSECASEGPYTAKLASTTCKKCNTGKLEPSARSQRDAAGDVKPFYRNTVALALVALTVCMAVAYAYLQFKNRQPIEKSDELYCHYRCIKCKRRLRLAMRSYPRKALCPTCKCEFDVPAAQTQR